MTDPMTDPITDDKRARKAPLIGYFVWLIFVMVVLAIAAIVGPRIWQGATFADQTMTPASAKALSKADEEAATPRRRGDPNGQADQAGQRAGPQG